MLKLPAGRKGFKRVSSNALDRLEDHSQNQVRSIDSAPYNCAMLRDDFERDGFVVVPDVFTGDELATLSNEVDRVVEGRAEYLPAEQLVYEPNTEPPRVRNAFHLHHYSDIFLKAAKNPELLELLGSILGKPLRLYASQVFAKPALVGSIVPSHQDMPYWPFEPYEMISAWIAMDDSTIENGCVRHVAGSHKLGILPHAPSGVVGNSLSVVEDPRLKELTEVPVEVRKGSVILHHCLTVHRSEPNRSPKPRRGLIYVYMSDQVRVTDPSKLRQPATFPIVSN
ncbi:MAG: phytanoyl-CoA dioxygenase family protein [Acidobacteriota bacterium]